MKELLPLFALGVGGYFLTKKKPATPVSILPYFKDNGYWEVFCKSCGYEDNVLNAFYDHRFSALLVKMPTWICVGVKPIQ